VDKLDELRARNAELETRISDLERDLAFYKEKRVEELRFLFAILHDGLPPEKIAGRRSYFLAQRFFSKPQFKSDAALARHLGITPAAVSQQLNEFLNKFPVKSLNFTTSA
jgi:DNA-binding MarR family transcriptional regulator